MMGRAALVLAILAALVGAPSSLLAAPPNQLSDATASPTSGGTLTVFVLSVRYTSAGGNPARDVVAEAGPVSVRLSLVSGTSTDGAWRGSTLLPVGIWLVTFRATVDRGPQPSLSGPTITVAAPPGPTPLPSGADIRPAPAPAEAEASVTPAVNPQATAPPASATPDARPASSPKATGAATGEPAPNAEPPFSGPAASVDAQPVPASPAASREGSNADTSPGGATSSIAGAARASAGGSQLASGGPARPLERDPSNPASSDLFLLLGVVLSVATVTLLGTGWMLAVRGRDEPSAVSAGHARRSAGAARRAAEIEARRARRRAQRLPGHDPVLAALGLDTEDDADAGLAPRRGSARGATPTPRRGPRR